MQEAAQVGGLHPQVCLRRHRVAELRNALLQAQPLQGGRRQDLLNDKLKTALHVYDTSHYLISGVKLCTLFALQTNPTNALRRRTACKAWLR